MLPDAWVQSDVAVRPCGPSLHRAGPLDGDRSARHIHCDVRRSRARRPQVSGRCERRTSRGVRATDRLIRITTALAVATVAAVAAVISYRHAYELVSTHGETGLTARLIPFTVDGLILAASMLILDASRRHQPVPPLARWCLGAGILATIGANLAHGLAHGPIGALVSAWPALALAGSFELLMTLVRSETAGATPSQATPVNHIPSIGGGDAPPAPLEAPSVEQTVLAWHDAGHSQRAIARQLNLDRRKVKRIIDQAA